MRHFILLLLVTALLGSLADAHAIGVDFGSEYIKVAGPHADQSIDIVLNELSKRKTDNYIGFRNSERYIGDPAKTLAARFPLLTAAATNQLMGKQKDTAEISAFRDMVYEYDFQFGARNTAVVPIKDAHGPFAVEELYSMLLSYTAKIAALDGVADPKSAVVTIPFHASIAERRAILEAARLSNMEILGFLHSTTAAALYYGMRHRGFGTREVTMVVFDVGTTHTEAGVYRFTPSNSTKRGPLGESFGTLSTVAVIEDKTLGGRALDLCVAKIIEDEAVAKMGIKPVLGGRTPAQLKSQFSLIRAANKAREVLSANTNTPLSVEGIAPERDFHSTISREKYETQCAPLFVRVKQLVEEVLKTTNLTPENIDAFELMGGAARTPKIIADISAILGREVDRTLNMDEAAAVGAAYYSVKLSPFYRVKSFKVNEQVPFDISFIAEPAHTEGKPSHARQLFTAADLIGSSVSVTLNRTEDFTLKLFQGASPAEAFAEVRVSGVQEALAKAFSVPTVIDKHPNNTHIVRIQLRVNETGLVDPEMAEVVVRYAANTTRRVLVNETNDKGEVAPVSKTEHVVRMRQSVRKLKVQITWSSPREMTLQEWGQSSVKLFDIDEDERLKREKAEAKNNLEGYMFWVKGDGVLYNDDAMAKIDPANVEALRAAVNKVEEWLEDGHGGTDACTRAEYEREHDVLRSLVKESLGETDDATASAPEAAKGTAGEGEPADGGNAEVDDEGGSAEFPEVDPEDPPTTPEFASEEEVGEEADL